MSPDLHQLLETLKNHLPWLAPVLFWMGAARALLKLFNAPLQRFLTAFTLELAADHFNIQSLLQNRWYRLAAWLLDYFLSLKLPSAQITFMPAPSKYPPAALSLWLCGSVVILFLSGCAAPPVYSPVPPANPNHFDLPVPSSFPLLPSVKSPPRSYFLAWDYDSNSLTSTIFEIQRSTRPQGPFTHWTNAPGLYCALSVDLPAAYFIIRASNTITHLTSDFATK